VLAYQCEFCPIAICESEANQRVAQIYGEFYATDAAGEAAELPLNLSGRANQNKGLPIGRPV
jgi:hypothetical protein